MNDDFSELLNKFSDILKEKNIDLNNIAGGEPPPASNYNNDCDDSDFSLDIDTIMRIKNILSQMNNSKNSPRNHLLHSLKPYLEKDKQAKLDNYIKIANMLSVMENMDLGVNFFEKNNKGYDLILIITLVLLIV